MVQFDRSAGFCDPPFAVSLSTPLTGATLYYTTNGTRPEPNEACRYTRPLTVTSTTVVRAAAFSPETNRLGESVSTYLHIPAVLQQTGASCPAHWGTHRAWYQMATPDGESPAPAAEALRSLPSLSIVLDPEALFSVETGLYTHPWERGSVWERAASIEFFDTAGRLVFQTRTGLRIHGGTSRQPEESPKHSFRLNFKTRYGAAKLRHPLFGSDGPHQFDSLVLRAGHNDSWLASDGPSRRAATYLRDEWMRRSLLAMGYPSARGIFAHLYLNGLYWGVYNLCERIDASFIAANHSAPETEFDLRNAAKTESGDQNAWDRMMAMANAGVADEHGYIEIGQCLDLTQLADYLILNFYAGNADWDRAANWFAARPRTPDGRFQFLVWDAERTLDDIEANTLAFDDEDCPPRLFQKLSENAAFRRLLATRAQHLLFGSGPLSPDSSAQRYRALADTVAKAIPAEAARWGTYRRDLHPYKTGPYDRYAFATHWQPETNRLLTQYFPNRRDVLLKDFRQRGLWPPP